MNTLFLDTSGWFTALSARESRHRAAAAAYREQLVGGHLCVTTNLVVAEMQLLIGRVRGTAAALGFLDRLYGDPSHQVVFVDRDLERSAADRWLRRSSDQRLSLTDAVSFEVMRDRRISRALTLDRHFVVSGFERVPD